MASSTSEPPTWKEWEKFLEHVERGTVWNHVTVSTDNISIFLGCDVCHDQTCSRENTYLPQFPDPFEKLKIVYKGNAVPSSRCCIVLKRPTDEPLNGLSFSKINAWRFELCRIASKADQYAPRLRQTRDELVGLLGKHYDFGRKTAETYSGLAGKLKPDIPLLLSLLRQKERGKRVLK